MMCGRSLIHLKEIKRIRRDTLIKHTSRRHVSMKATSEGDTLEGSRTNNNIFMASIAYVCRRTRG